MANKMLIDATHPEETRVVVVRGSRVEEFDFEAAAKKQLRGNIYLAKVTRVEPSLQAAFVDYGGNRHGFLAFAEIHPDYYQIPLADRQALLEEEARMHSEFDREESRPRRSQPQSFRHEHGAMDESIQSDALPREGEQAHPGEIDDDASHAYTLPDGSDFDGLTPVPVYETEDGELIVDARDIDPAFFADEPSTSEPADHGDAATFHDEEDYAAVQSGTSNVEEVADIEDDGPEVEEIGGDGSSGDEDAPQPGRNRRRNGRNRGRGRNERSRDDEADEAGLDQVEVVGSEDALEEVPERRPAPRLRRHYKIQEVIKRRQVLLVQVVKEERGNKGAALTTYLSLAGRYSVLMPNTARGGGISRKITNIQDRKRLKGIAQELEVPEGMGVIVRTAGAARTKLEITRDFEYLLRLWENVRELTLQSTAPKLVYEEGSLIKRSIRDLYNKDIDEVIVAGDNGYREARDFMNMLMPDHTNNVRLYRELSPVFTRYGVESQLDAMFSPQVTLRSGGYIVINQTEALVSIDVNSGKSTREHNIEDTALQTNLEAAEEVARQLRLRDLAGLIVIDFIDMEEKRNDRSVERRLKDCLKNDRARIQVGRISHFGLMEMSRQRIRSGVLEASMVICQHCGGTGLVRSTESVALHVLRSIEESLIRGVTHDLIVRTRSSATLYILNQKRAHLADLERRFGLSIMVIADDHATSSGHLFVIERGEPVVQRVAPVAPHSAITQNYEDAYYDDVVYEEDEEEVEAVVAEETVVREPRREAARPQAERVETDANGRRKRRRRRRGRGRGDNDTGGDQGETSFAGPAGEFAASEIEGTDGDDDADELEVGIDEVLADGSPESAAERDAARAKRRRRGRRGGRRNRRDEDGAPAASGEDTGEDDVGSDDEDFDEVGETVAQDATDEAASDPVVAEAIAPEAEAPDFVVLDRETLTSEVEAQRAAEAEVAAKPVRKPRTRKPRATKAGTEETAVEAEATPAAAAEIEAPVPSAPEPAVDARPAPAAAIAEAAEPVEAPEAAKPSLTSTELDPSKPKKAGWWSRKIFGE